MITNEKYDTGQDNYQGAFKPWCVPDSQYVAAYLETYLKSFLESYLESLLESNLLFSFLFQKNPGLGKVSVAMSCKSIRASSMLPEAVVIVVLATCTKVEIALMVPSQLLGHRLREYSIDERQDDDPKSCSSNMSIQI